MNMVCMAFTATSSAFAATLMVFSAHSALFTEMSWAFWASSEISKEERAASAAATSAVVWADVAFNKATYTKNNPSIENLIVLEEFTSNLKSAEFLLAAYLNLCQHGSTKINVTACLQSVPLFDLYLELSGIRAETAKTRLTFTC